MLLSWSMYYDDDCTASSNDYTLMLIENSTFAYGASGGNKASGLHVDYQQSCKSIFVTLTNTTFIGNIAVYVKQHNRSQDFHFQLEKSVGMKGLAIGNKNIAAGMSFMIEGDSPTSQYHLNMKNCLFKENKNGLGRIGGLQLDIITLRQRSMNATFSIIPVFMVERLV